MSGINSLYLLTPMTGRTSGADRTLILATVEMKWRTFIIGLIALVPGAILAGLFFPLIGSWCMLWIAATETAAFLLIERRSADGLRLRTYQSMFDKKRSNLNTFFMCGQPVEVTGATFGKIQQISTPVTPKANPDAVFDTESAEARTR